MEEKVRFSDGHGNKVSAILSTPDHEDKQGIPIVIMCHGLGTGKDSATNLALERIFLKQGIATFRFDFFAHGESEGKVENRSVTLFVNDILKAIEYVKNKGYNRMGICGASLGGVAAVIAASKTPYLSVMVLKAAGMGNSRNMPNYKKEFDAKTWIEAGKKVGIPTLIVHGTADEEVEVKLGKELASSIKGSLLELVEGADHMFSKKEDFERMVKDISTFMIRNILKKG